MPSKRRLSDIEITYSDVKDDESNILHKLTLWDKKCEFLNRLYRNLGVIQAIAAHHLGLNTRLCQVAEPEEWLYGSFNLCIPVTTVTREAQTTKRVIIRFPLPYQVGEHFRPGNADEKLRCEAGTYIWLQQHCPSVPTPRLHGFGLSTGQTFSALEHLPLISRLTQHIRRMVLAWLGRPIPSRYVRHQGPSLGSLNAGYLLIDYIEKSQGTMLSCTWNEKHSEIELRKNLFRGLCRILLSVARVPLPRIGSFTIDDNGFLLLANRPLSLEIHQLENQQIPVDIPRHLTYTSVDSYVTDILTTLHDSRLRHQPNGISNEEDCIYQMSALTVMKAVSTLFLRRDLRNGPFVFTLNDLHQSNIFVDENWNIKYLIDLEWACSCPVEMTQPPRWLTNQAIDEIDAEEYDRIRREFMDVLEKTEQELPTGLDQRLSSIMEEGWKTGTFWYTLALRSPAGLCRVFYDHIQPRLAHGHEDNAAFYKIMMYYWTTETRAFIREKLKQKEGYDSQLREAFED